MTNRKTLRTLALLIACLALAASAGAQSFSSGSTGADGALDLRVTAPPPAVCAAFTEFNADTGGRGTCEIQLPENGVLNLTLVYIPADYTVSFRKNSRNTAVILLVQGDVTIAGTLDVSAVDAPGGYVAGPGPGGFLGGMGPGRGEEQGAHAEGWWAGPISLVPPVGGSGGANSGSRSGGSGGGAVVIAAGGGVVVPDGGYIKANSGYTQTGYQGSGGAIRLVANAIRVTGTGSLRACPMSSGWWSCTGTSGQGIIRLEAPLNALEYTVAPSGQAYGVSPSPIVTDPNPAIVTSTHTQAGLTITSIGGYVVPTTLRQRLDTADMVLPSQLPDPISVVVQAQGIPVGTAVNLAVVSLGSLSTASVASEALAGTLESSTATLSVSGLDRNVVSYLMVSAEFVPPEGAGANPPGPDQVASIRGETIPGQPTRWVFRRSDGSAIPAGRVPLALRERFGQ